MLSAAPIAALIGRYIERENLSRYALTLEVIVDRTAAQFSAWYELFPRSQSDDPRRATALSTTSLRKLPYVRDLGFDVLYFPPIHPIGTTNRKGKNNALKAAAGDVGSVYAIGSRGRRPRRHPSATRHAGGVPRLVEAAKAHGLEIALDFAIQCSPDHPWIKQHPEWFDWRPDGTLKFAENPPKKYEDIVNVALLRRVAAGAVAGAARRRPVLGGQWRAHLPRRQSAHQAAAVLALADPLGERPDTRM